MAHDMTAKPLAIAAFFALVGPASAQNAIGQMDQVQGSVSGTVASRIVPLANGTSVVQNEVVSTAAASTARVAFHDLTSLAIAENSAVKLDRFVFNPDSTASRAAINLTRGAFRLVTGNSPSKNIAVRTPVATIGLRGTTVDVLVRRGREIVVLRQGATTVCVGRQCVPVDVPGTGVIIAGGSVSQPGTEAVREFDFDAMTGNRFYSYNPYLAAPRGETQGGSSQSQSYSGPN